MTEALYEPTIAKLRRLPEPLLHEVDAFIDFLEMRHQIKQVEPNGNDDADAEAGMDSYLRDLESYEERLASGSVTWQ